MSKTGIIPQLPIHLIQAMRLVHALAESDYEVCIPADQRVHVRQLTQEFGLSFRTDVANCRPLTGLAIDHKTPSSAIGTLRRTLIYPHAILDKCRGMWPASRPIRFSFAGLLTDSRRKTLQQWLAQSSNLQLPAAPKPLPWSTFVGKVFRKLGVAPSQNVTKTQVGDLLLWSSTRGRSGALKAWDQEYHELVTASQFVLCPSGDFVWTYRFFEAAMCGAIPVVEASCPVYAGFHYYSMDQAPATLQWSAEWAAANYELCRQQLTIPHDELNSEITRLLAQ